jgi:hypothetical protein
MSVAGLPLVLASVSAVAFTLFAVFFRRGWVPRGIWAPWPVVVLSGVVNFVAVLVWANAADGLLTLSGLAFGLFAQYTVLAAASDAKGWLIAKEITWPPIVVGVSALVMFSTAVGPGVFPSTPGGWWFLASAAVVVAALGLFFYGVPGLIAGVLGVWAGILFLQAGLLGGVLLLLLAGLFSIRSGFGMGFGDVRMAGVAAATLWWVPVDFVMVGFVLFAVSTLVWAALDDRKKVEGKSWIHRKVPLAPTFCVSMGLGALSFLALATLT